VVLSEVGPALFSDMVSAGADPFTLCLTLSPLLAGTAPGRLPMIDGPGGATGELDGIMSAGSHLFLRYKTRP
jgi:hypothetical protein